MSWWSQETGTELLCKTFPKLPEWQYWLRLYEGIHSGKRKNAWDYQLMLSMIRHNQLCIVPGVNLISDVGCDSDATHCTWENAPYGNQEKVEIEQQLSHPNTLQRNHQMDHLIFRARFSIKTPSLYKRAVNYIARKLQNNATRLNASRPWQASYERGYFLSFRSLLKKSIILNLMFTLHIVLFQTSQR